VSAVDRVQIRPARWPVVPAQAGTMCRRAGWEGRRGCYWWGGRWSWCWWC